MYVLSRFKIRIYKESLYAVLMLSVRKQEELESSLGHSAAEDSARATSANEMFPFLQNCNGT